MNQYLGHSEGTDLTAEYEMERCQSPDLIHHTSQALRYHAESHAHDEQEEERQRVTRSVEDGDNKEKSERTGTPTVLVDISIVGVLRDHLNDEKDDRTRDIILHRAKFA